MQQFRKRGIAKGRVIGLLNFDQAAEFIFDMRAQGMNAAGLLLWDFAFGWDTLGKHLAERLSAGFQFFYCYVSCRFSFFLLGGFFLVRLVAFLDVTALEVTQPGQMIERPAKFVRARHPKVIAGL